MSADHTTTDAAAPKAAARSAPQRAMDKLGLVRDIDLALHLMATNPSLTAVPRSVAIDT